MRRLLLLLLVLLAFPAAAEARELVVDPEGSGSACTAAQPCALATVFGAGGAVSGDVVTVRPGTYGSSDTSAVPAGAQLSGVTVRSGDRLPRRPLIWALGGLTIADGSISGLELINDDNARPGLALTGGAIAERMDVSANTAEGTCAVSGTAILRSSRCQGGPAGVGVVLRGSALARHVSAGSLGAAGIAALGAGTAARVVNSRVLGGSNADDVVVEAGAALTADHSYIESASGAGSFTATAPVGADQVVDAGTAAGTGGGELDYNGNRRDLGAAPDVGRLETVTELPEVTSNAATDIGRTSATLTGTIKPRGSRVDHAFEFGPTSAYGSNTPPAQTFGNVTTVIPGDVLTGLQPATTYHYALVAINERGEARSADRTFTTAGGTPTATTGDVTSITKTGARVAGTVDTKGLAGTVTFEAVAAGRPAFTRTIELGAAFGAREVSGIFDVLPSGTTFTTRIRVTTDDGSADGAAASFATLAGVTRHAAPAGTRSACTTAQPCALDQAITDTQDGDALVLAGGDYGSAAAPALSRSQRFTSVTIDGTVTGPGRARVFMNGGLELLGASAIEDVDVRATDDNDTAIGINDTTTADRVIGIGGGDGCAVRGAAGLRNSVCANRTDQRSGLFIAGTGTARNVTTAGDIGVFAGDSAGIVNAIVRGVSTGVVRSSGAATLDRSAVTTPSAVTGTNPITPFPGLTADYRAATTTAVDRGTDVGVGAGELDLDGNLRLIGAGVDAGAYELVTTKPGATTGSATDVTTATATLNGALDTQGGATTYRFEYGPTAAYGTLTPPVSVTGAEGGAVSAAVADLPSNTTLHYRLVATNDAGTTTGADATTATRGRQPAVTTGSATDVTATSATLSATVDTQGEAATVTVVATGGGVTRTVEQELTAAAGTRTVTADVTGLPAGVTVTWHAEVLTRGDFERRGATGADATFDTLALPTAVTGTASAVTTSTATLSGTVDTQGLAGTVRFEVTPEGGATQTLTQAIGAGDGVRTVTADVTGLSADTPVTSRITVETTTGTAAGEPVGFRTLPTPPADTPTPSPSPSPAAPQPAAPVAPAPPVPAPGAAEPVEPSLRVKLRKGLAAGQLLLSRRDITLFVRCGDAACRATGTGVVRVGGTRVGTLAAPPRAQRLSRGERGRILLRSSKALRAKVRRLLTANPRRRATIAFRATFTGADGTRIRRTVTIKVRQLD